MLRRRLALSVGFALVPLALFSSLVAGLRVPSVGHPSALLPAGLDYARGATHGYTPLRTQFIEDVFGSVTHPAVPSGVLVPAGVSSEIRTLLETPPTEVTHDLTNDDFADAYRVRSIPFKARSNTSEASRESNETSCSPVGGKTVWYRFDAAIDMGLTADTFGTDHAVSLGVFAGERLSELERVGCSTDARGNAHVPFPAVAGTTYYFQITSVSGGDLVFDLRLQGITTPLTPRERFTFALWGSTSDGRWWSFTAIENVGSQEDCVGVIVGMPVVPRACRMHAFVVDATTAKITRVSVSSDGTPGNDSSVPGGISAGGRYVSFTSWATNLVADDTNVCYLYTNPGQCPDVFVHDRDADGNGIFDEPFPGARKTIRVSVAPNADGGRDVQGNDWSALGTMSADGRYVMMQSEASNLVEADTNGVGDGFVHDRDADGNGIFDETFPGARRMIRVTVSSTGEQAEDAPLSVSRVRAAVEGRDYFPAERGNQILGISSNGRYAVFRSQAANLVAGDTNGVYDVFLRDIAAGTTTRVNVSSEGIQADEGSRLHNTFYRPVSDDGRYVLFVSDATNLVPNDTNDGEDLFMRDVVGGTTRRLTLAWNGDQVKEPPTTGQDAILGGVFTLLSIPVWSGDIWTLSELNHAMSADGRYVFFSSGAQLVPEDLNEQRDIYVRDLRWGTIALVSVSTAGRIGNGSSNVPSPSPDGRTIVFQSYATNLDGREDSEVAASLIWAPYLRVLPGGA